VRSAGVRRKEPPRGAAEYMVGGELRMNSDGLTRRDLSMDREGRDFKRSKLRRSDVDTRSAECVRVWSGVVKSECHNLSLVPFHYPLTCLLGSIGMNATAALLRSVPTKEAQSILKIDGSSAIRIGRSV
jgi:hypothetical protein